MTKGELEAALLAAHADGDGPRISAIYAAAAECEPDPGARAFLLTQAYVFALEAGIGATSELRAALIALGAERER